VNKIQLLKQSYNRKWYW